MEEVKRIYEIGTSVDIECTYDLSSLVSENKYERPKFENIFFELYLVDWDGSLIDVPILLGNQIDSNFGGSSPNMETDEESWILTRRFFLFDTISGIPEGEYPDGIPEIIRYPRSIKLIINLDSRGDTIDASERINVPVLFIEYLERTRDYINLDDTRAKTTKVKFATEYRLDFTNMWANFKMVFWISMILMAVLCCM